MTTTPPRSSSRAITLVRAPPSASLARGARPGQLLTLPGGSFMVQVSDGLYNYLPEEQLLVYKHGSLDVPVHSVTISRTTSA